MSAAADRTRLAIIPVRATRQPMPRPAIKRSRMDGIIMNVPRKIRSMLSYVKIMRRIAQNVACACKRLPCP